MSTSGTIWPKNLAPLSEEQRRISDDFMKYWHEVLPKKYSVIDKFNHSYAVRASAGAFSRHAGDRRRHRRAPSVRTTNSASRSKATMHWNCAKT